MKFSEKIGLSFLAVALLTAVTGSIGLLFVHRVLQILGSVDSDEGPLVRNLADLGRYARETVAISQEVSPRLELEEILRLRRDLSRVAHEFDRAFAEIRKGLDDEMALGTLQSFYAGGRELGEQTQTLLAALVDEVRAQRVVRERLAEAHTAWAGLLAGMGAVSATDTQAAGFEFFPGVARLQHRLMLVRIEAVPQPDPEEADSSGE